MKKLNLLIMLAFLTVFSSFQAFSQDEEESPFSVSTDLMSRYVWRGTDFGGSPSIQPCFEYSKGNLTIGAWGAFTTNLPGAQEADIYLSYNIGEMFTVTLTDYFFPNELVGNDAYFNYKKGETGHIFELSATFNGTEDLPLSFTLATNLFGADALKHDENGLPTEDIQYSTYAELGYEFKNLEFFAGFNLLEADQDRGESGFYGDYMGFVNIGVTRTKELKITDSFKVPLSVSFITNPQAEKVYMVAGISF